ncbi:MAG: hypothetical protein ABL907_03960 [Hyphomicrobium sp.]
MTIMPDTYHFQLAQKLPRPDVVLAVQVKTPGEEFKTLNVQSGAFAEHSDLIAEANRMATRWSLSGAFNHAEFRILRVNNR